MGALKGEAKEEFDELGDEVDRLQEEQFAKRDKIFNEYDEKITKLLNRRSEILKEHGII